MIAAGGTGGHIYPGIAVAQEIMRRDASSKVQFVGTAKGLESRLVSRAGFELSLIESAGLKNVSLGARMKGVALLPRSFNSARKLMRQFQPDVVVGAGGYKDAAIGQAVYIKKIYPPRGIIYDRNNKVLMNNSVVYDLVAEPSKIKADFDTGARSELFTVPAGREWRYSEQKA